MPAPPTDQDLVSDGTPEARKALMGRYGVYIENKAVDVFRVVRTGDARRPYAKFFLGTTDQDVRTYLAADPEAAGHLHAFQRETLGNLLTEGPRLALLPLGPLLSVSMITLLVLNQRGVHPASIAATGWRKRPAGTAGRRLWRWGVEVPGQFGFAKSSWRGCSRWLAAQQVHGPAWPVAAAACGGFTECDAGVVVALCAKPLAQLGWHAA